MFPRFRRALPYKANLNLALPVVAAQVGQVVVQLADNAMVGQLGAVPLAAISFSGAVFTIFMFWGMGLAMGLTPLVGTAYSQGRLREAGGLFCNGLILYGAVGVLLFGVLWLLGGWLDHMGQAPEVVEQAVPYFRWLAWSILPCMIFVGFKQFLEGVGNTRIAMVVVLSANGVNILLNYLLIYGHGGFTAMGAEGAGLATFLARLLMPLGTAVAVACNGRYNRYYRFFASGMARFGTQTQRLIRLGWPISVQVVLEISAFALSSVMMGWIGAVALAAHQIVISIGTFTYMVQVGIATAATILVSHAQGRGDRRAVRLAARASCTLALLFALCMMCLLFVLRHYIPLGFTSDLAVVHVAAQLFLFLGLYQLSDGIQTALVGVLRGVQEVSALARYAFVSYILLNLPVGYVCAFVLGMGARGLWVGFICGLTLAAVLYYNRYRRFLRRSIGRS